MNKITLSLIFFGLISILPAGASAADEHDHEQHEHETEHAHAESKPTHEEDAHDHAKGDEHKNGHEEHDHEEEQENDDHAMRESSHDEHNHADHGADRKEEGDDHGDEHAHDEEQDHDDHAEDEPSHDEHDHADHDAEHKDDGDGHEDEHDHGHEGHEEESVVRLNERQRKAAGIITEILQPRPLNVEIRAPGEIHLNAYATTRVTPRIPAQVLDRHVYLGEQVNKGQPLATLSSVEMAGAQGALLVADIEWRRVKKLGREVVSERRYVEAQVARQQAYAKVLAYGMTTARINRLLKDADPAKATGKFSLLSTQKGTVIHDDFTLGEMVEPGRELFEITDRSSVWVEARLAPAQARLIDSSATVRIDTDIGQVSGRIARIHPALDETTRTQGVRIKVLNPDGRLQAGRFVEVWLSTRETGEPVLAVEDEAVLRSPDGDWQVFVENDAGEFEPKEVEILRRTGGMAVIEGLETGTRIVTQGAFFLQSELAKAGFDPHNH